MTQGLFDQLSGESRDRMIDAGVRRRYPARSYLFHDGDDPSSVFVIEAGLIRVDRTTKTGRCVLFELAMPGDTVGELGVIDPAPRSATASTITDSRVVVLTAAEFLRVLELDRDASQVVMKRVVRRLRLLSDQLIEATSQSASSRVAARLERLLVLAGHEHDGPVELTLPITQAELGQWAGLSREGVVKGLGELRRKGLIETGRRRLSVLDPAGLAAMAARAEG